MNAADRIASFSRGAALAPDLLYVHQRSAWRYLIGHPFSEELAFHNPNIDRYDESPLHLLWELENEVFSLKVNLGEGRDGAARFCFNTRSDGYREIEALIDEFYICRQTVEDTMDRLHLTGRLQDPCPDSLTLFVEAPRTDD